MWASSPGLASKHLLLRICRRIPRCITTLLARFAPQLQEMNPGFADLIKRKTRIPSNTGFILPAVADGSRFHALCRKIAFYEGSGKNSGDHKAEQEVMGREKGRFCAVLGLPGWCPAPFLLPTASPSGRARGKLGNIGSNSGMHQLPNPTVSGDSEEPHLILLIPTPITSCHYPSHHPARARS
jgi:hypothetical protein